MFETYWGMIVLVVVYYVMWLLLLGRMVVPSELIGWKTEDIEFALIWNVRSSRYKICTYGIAKLVENVSG